MMSALQKKRRKQQKSYIQIKWKWRIADALALILRIFCPPLAHFSWSKTLFFLVYLRQIYCDHRHTDTPTIIRAKMDCTITTYNTLNMYVCEFCILYHWNCWQPSPCVHTKVPSRKIKTFLLQSIRVWTLDNWQTFNHKKNMIKDVETATEQSENYYLALQCRLLETGQSRITHWSPLVTVCHQSAVICVITQDLIQIDMKRIDETGIILPEKLTNHFTNSYWFYVHWYNGKSVKGTKKNCPIRISINMRRKKW